MDSVDIFNPTDVPFGHLSNNFYFPVWIEDTLGIGKNKKNKWDTITRYIYAKLLWNPEGQMIIKNKKRLNPNEIKEIYQEFDRDSVNVSVADTAAVIPELPVTVIVLPATIV